MISETISKFKRQQNSPPKAEMNAGVGVCVTGSARGDQRLK